MTIQNYIVQFDLPYHIQVEDSFKQNKEARFYPVINRIPAEIRFESNTEDSHNVAIAGTAIGDRHGNLGHSSVQVWFDEQFIQTIPDDIDDEKIIEPEPVFQMRQPRGRDRYLIESAVKYMNKFLNVYRAITMFYWITPLSPREITRFTVIDRHKDDSTDSRIHFVTESALKLGPMNEEILNTVRRGIQQESPISLYNELDLNAEDKIDRGDFNSAIIDSATLFESWLKTAFETIAREQGYSKKEAQDMITKGGDSDEYLSPKNIALDHIGKLGFDFSDTEEFSKWDRQTHEIRNQVVHEGYQASRKEAREAKEAAVGAIIRLANEFQEELEGTVLFVQERSERHLSRRGQNSF